MSDRTFLALFALAAYVFASIFFASGFYLRSKVRRLLASALPTKGVIACLEPTVSMSSSSIYRVFRVFITFRDAQGIEHRVKSTDYVNPGDYKEGDVVELFYNPQSPQEAVIDPKTIIRMAHICLFAASLATILATIIFASIFYVGK